MTTWKCAYCGSINRISQEFCGENMTTHGCGKPRKDANEEFGPILMGLFRGGPIYDSDLRQHPELKQHEDFTVIGKTMPELTVDERKQARVNKIARWIFCEIFEDGMAHLHDLALDNSS